MDVLFTAHGPLHMAHCTWPTAHGPLYMVHCTWPTAHGPLHMAHCTWSTVHGPLHMAHCTWSAAHGRVNLDESEELLSLCCPKWALWYQLEPARLNYSTPVMGFVSV